MPVINPGVLEGLRKIGLRVRDLAVDGVPGATLGMRLRGATASGAPAVGTWRAGDVVLDQAAGVLRACTVGGTGAQASWAGGSGAYLRPPAVISTGTTFTTTSSTFAAISSGAVSTGVFTAPPSGEVVVEADVVMNVTAATTFGFALAVTGTVTPVVGKIVGGEMASTNPWAPTRLPFPVTGLTPGASYNYDLLWAVLSSNTLSATAFSNTSTTLSSADKGGPIVIAVKAV